MVYNKEYKYKLGGFNLQKENQEKSEVAEAIIEKTLQIPGVKVSRKDFLSKTFADRKNANELVRILEKGPYEAGVERKELDNIANSLIQRRTLTSSSASFAAGLPGGFAMVGTIPADTAQFFGVTIRLAQELAYLYGHEDLWLAEHLNTEKARHSVMLYLGVMFGASGSTSLLKYTSTNLSKELAKRLPNKALTHTFYYPLIKKIAGYIGVKVTKDTFAKSVSKTVPVIGGAVSGGITFTSMRKMGKKLAGNLSEALVMDAEDLEKEYKNLRKNFPEIGE